MSSGCKTAAYTLHNMHVLYYKKLRAKKKAMEKECTVCRSVTTKGSRKSLCGSAAGSERVYSALLELLTDGKRQQCDVSLFHKFLGSGSSFLCKSCYNSVVKLLDLKEKLSSQLLESFSAACVIEVGLYNNNYCQQIHLHDNLAV